MYIIIEFSFFPKKDRDKMVKIFRKCMYARKKFQIRIKIVPIKPIIALNELKGD